MKVECFLNQWMDFFKLASIYHCEKLKSVLDFWYLDLISRTQEDLGILTFHLNEVFLEPLAKFLPNWHSMLIFNLDPFKKFIVLYVGYHLNEQMKFLQFASIHQRD